MNATNSHFSPKDVDGPNAKPSGLTPPPDVAGSGVPEAAPTVRMNIAPIRVLVIDDDSVARIVIKKYLAKMGLPVPVEVLLASSAKEAQEQIAAVAPDIILTDVCMSGIDGFEMIEWIRAQPGMALTPVIVSSSIPQAIGKQRCLLIGADTYLQKPISVEALTRVMTRMLARVRPEVIGLIKATK